MPQRTNEFQKLVYLVKQHVADGAVVTESKMVRDRHYEREREVDIWIEAVVAGHQVVVAVECMAEADGADVTWIDEMLGKHQSLPTNQLVLASKAGFSSGAIAKARTNGIELISLDRMDADEAKRVFGGASSIWFKLFNMSATKVVMRVAESEGGLDAENVAVAPETLIYDRQGSEVCTAKMMVDTLLKSKYAIEQFGERGDESHKWFTIAIEPVYAAYLKKVDLDRPLLRPVESIRITGTCNFDVAQFKLQHGKLKDVSLAWGTGSFQGTKTLLVASADKVAGQKFTLTTHPKR